MQRRRIRSKTVVLASLLGLAWGLAGLTGCTADSVPATVVGWNIQGVGAPDSGQFAAAVEVLEAIEPDIIALSEINSLDDVDHLEMLAIRLGMEPSQVTDKPPFGSMRTGFISRWPVEWNVLDARELAEETDLPVDQSANDISRFVAVAKVLVPDARPVFVLPVHLKSGNSNNDQLRRVIESFRTRQALGEGLYVVIGDFNDQITDVPHMPQRFREIPNPMTLPGDWRIGLDMARAMVDDGLYNDPFAPLLDPEGPGLMMVQAARTNGDEGTRPASGRRLDYALVSPELWFDAEGWLYHSDDDGRLGDRDPAPLGSSEAASDHLPVVVDLEVPPPCIFDRDCDDGLWCTGAERCDFGTCLSGRAPCAGVCEEGRQRCE